jgi:ABC-type sugar transport system substrate-binding protein
VNIQVIEVTKDSTTAASCIAGYLTSHPKTAAVITSGAIAADAAAVAEEQMKLAPGQIRIIGQVTSPNTVKAVKDGLGRHSRRRLAPRPISEPARTRRSISASPCSPSR